MSIVSIRVHGWNDEQADRLEQALDLGVLIDMGLAKVIRQREQ